MKSFRFAFIALCVGVGFGVAFGVACHVAPSEPPFDAGDSLDPVIDIDATPATDDFDDGATTASGCRIYRPPCPDSGAPTYEGEIKPLIDELCITCHTTGAPFGAKYDFTTYSQFPKIKGTAYYDVYHCKMPPPEAGAHPTLDERKLLLEWFACGAPEK